MSKRLEKKKAFIPAFPKLGQPGYGTMLKKDFLKNKYIYLMALPVVLYYVLFHYMPMYGVIISFKKFTPAKGIMGSPWVGFKYFRDFFNAYYFWRLIRNTLLLSFNSLLWGFPAPIILALLMNELRSNRYKRIVQSLTYVPHFISVVVVCGLLLEFSQLSGLFNDLRVIFGLEKVAYFQKPEYFRLFYISSGIWQEIGWGTIIYLSALSSIDPQIYEAGTIDGASRWMKVIYITIPSIIPTIIILFIMRMGRMLTVGHEKIILLYNPSIYESADVISTFVYRKGLLEFSWSYSTAVGLFNSVINFVLLIGTNTASRKLSETSLW